MTDVPTPSKEPGKLVFWALKSGDFWCASYVLPGMKPEEGFQLGAIRLAVVESDGKCKAEFKRLAKRSATIFLNAASPAAAKIMRDGPKIMPSRQ